MQRPLIAILLSASISPSLCAQDIGELAVEPKPTRPVSDWLLDPSGYSAGIYRSQDGKSLVLSNGLIRREIRITPNAATTALDNLITGESVLRGVKPEARVTIDGMDFDVGGLAGQTNYAFLRREWVDTLKAVPSAMQFADFTTSQPEAPFGWKRTRHHDTSSAWPPEGIALQMRYTMPTNLEDMLSDDANAIVADSDAMSTVAFTDAFTTMTDAWVVHRSTAHPRSSFENEGKPGEIMTPSNTACYAERKIAADTVIIEATLDAGTDKSASWGPGIALVTKSRTIKFHMRPGGGGYDGKPRFGAFDGKRERDALGGRMPIDASTAWTLRIRIGHGKAHLEAKPKGGTWRSYHKLPFPKSEEPVAMRVGKMDVQGGKGDFSTPGELVRLHIHNASYYTRPQTNLDQPTDSGPAFRARALSQIEVTVHYELYDGIPCFAKWITVHNKGEHPHLIDRFTSEILAAVEPESRVETRKEIPFPKPNLWVETDYATGGANENGQRWSVHWVTDPEYKTQVNYQRQTPCLLECRPSVGPAQDLPAQSSFRSFRSFVLVHDSDRRSRNGLARCKMYRSIAPWVTENPLMMHVRFADWKSVKSAIDQCAEVGFEMVILTFGSGFNMENDKPEYLAEMKRYADYAHSKGIQIGGYSLLSSRRIGKGNDVVSPPGERPTHGSCPSLTSAWGLEYYKKLYRFFPATGFSLLEHDGPYPGDFDVTARPPLQKGHLDSQWVQFWIAANHYRWCREQGIYLNTPDWYYLNGSTKSAMGYREVNWSLPREDQVIHTRQNIFDGTWAKTPTMGWMFVPLTQYQGGGAAATVEPLHEHLDHYRRLLESNLSAGVQACYRGPRIYDTQATRDVVKAQVDWFKRYRRVLESDIDHAASRRPDGRDLDWILHVDPTQTHKGMLLVHNPLKHDVKKTLRINLYYTGITKTAQILDGSGKESSIPLDRGYHIEIPLEIKSGTMQWYLLRGE